MDKKKIAHILTKELSEDQVLIDEPMKKHTSFKIGGTADIFVKVRKIQELAMVIEIARHENVSLTVIGNGSNILVKDNGIRGIVLNLELNEIIIEKDIVTVGAGVKLGALTQILQKQELAGFEFAAGIPGTIGGAIRMNAGAHGGEMQDIVIETKYFDLEEYENMVTKQEEVSIPIGNDRIENLLRKREINLVIKTLNNEEQDFSYRHSIFMEKRYIVLETKLQLHKGNKEEIREKMDQYLLIRKEKQPINMPSAGSTFKRGNDFITAKIIDECGLKGYCIGDAEVSTIHAGFIVNKGNATAKDVLDLIQYVQDTVYEKTQKRIELEIEVLGE